MRPGFRKYGNKKVEYDGRKFDSARERDRYILLKHMQSQGEIRDLECQPEYHLSCGDRPILLRSKRYPNGRRARFRPDFRYVIVATCKTVIEDSKGFRTPDYVMRRGVFEAMYPHLKVDEV